MIRIITYDQIYVKSQQKYNNKAFIKHTDLKLNDNNLHSKLNNRNAIKGSNNVINYQNFCTLTH